MFWYALGVVGWMAGFEVGCIEFRGDFFLDIPMSQVWMSLSNMCVLLAWLVLVWGFWVCVWLEWSEGLAREACCMAIIIEDYMSETLSA